jgi:hypothetical protein
MLIIISTKENLSDLGLIGDDRKLLEVGDEEFN